MYNRYYTHHHQHYHHNHQQHQHQHRNKYNNNNNSIHYNIADTLTVTISTILYYILYYLYNSICNYEDILLLLLFLPSAPLCESPCVYGFSSSAGLDCTERTLSYQLGEVARDLLPCCGWLPYRTKRRWTRQ